MKQINVYFEDNEFEKLLETKNNKSWHDFILQLLPNEDKDDD